MCHAEWVSHMLCSLITWQYLSGVLVEIFAMGETKLLNCGLLNLPKFTLSTQTSVACICSLQTIKKNYLKFWSAEGSAGIVLGSNFLSPSENYAAGVNRSDDGVPPESRYAQLTSEHGTRSCMLTLTVQVPHGHILYLPQRWTYNDLFAQSR